MTKLTETRQLPGTCPPLRKSTSSPSARTLRGQPETDTFTKQLQIQAARARDLETTTPESERWMHVVMRRETLKHAKGKIVHVKRVGGEIKTRPQ